MATSADVMVTRCPDDDVGLAAADGGRAADAAADALVDGAEATVGPQAETARATTAAATRGTRGRRTR
jgi:hypothetical protein